MIPNALFPVIDSDGIAKPALLVLVEQALQAGVEQVVVVAAREDAHTIRALFQDQVPIAQYNKLEAGRGLQSRSCSDTPGPSGISVRRSRLWCKNPSRG